MTMNCKVVYVFEEFVFSDLNVLVHKLNFDREIFTSLTKTRAWFEFQVTVGSQVR